MSLLSFDGVSKSFADGSRRKIVVLDGVSLEIDAGDFVGLQGARRAGKSTLLRVAAGIEPPDAGHVYFGGRDVGEMSEKQRTGMWRHGGVALVRGSWQPAGSRPVLEHVGFGLLSDDLTPDEARVRAGDALERVGARSSQDTTTDRLSLGERVRVELARALVREPRLLLMDEPAVLPGRTESRELYALLRSLGDDPALALLIASEDLDAISGARRLMSIDNGRVRSTDSHDNLFHLDDLRAGGGEFPAS
jgi:ABC-type methionine transport system ATPase subunit